MSEYRLNAQLNDKVILDITTDNLAELGNALVFFGLANAAPVPDLPVEPAPQPVAEPVAEEPVAPKPRNPRKPKPEPEPVAAVEEEPAAEVSEPVAQPASSVSSAPSATPAEAAEAVRAYGAKNGIAAARELLQRFGFAKTAEITADKAGDVVAACNE
jgi:outer membrane biosynthesis protein TonB